MKTIFLLMFCVGAGAVKANELDKAITALVQVESKGNPNVVGDKGLTHKAYGILQIRKPYLDDVNRLARTSIKSRWGKDKLTSTDMKDSEKAEWVARIYLSYYGRMYTQKTGKSPTAVVYARIHNGGPDGWKEAETVNHGNKVEKVLRKGE